MVAGGLVATARLLGAEEEHLVLSFASSLCKRARQTCTHGLAHSFIACSRLEANLCCVW